MKKIIIFYIIIALFSGTNFLVYASDSFSDDKPSAEEMLVDVFLVRPIGIITSVMGTGFFIVSLPFSFLGGNTVDVFNELVAGPITFTFKRPVGELDY